VGDRAASSQSKDPKTVNTNEANANTLTDEADESQDQEEGRDGCMNLARVVPSIKNSGVTMRTSNNLNLYSRPGPVENHDLL